MTIEDGGIKVYRPLLAFPKDRLIATCLENDIPWFEDHTNADPTFTTRNTLRYLAKNHRLPAALQKPAILRLAARCRTKVAREEAEAERWLSRMMVRDFKPNVGSVVIQMPEFALPRVPRSYLRSPARRRRRLEHYRVIASVLFRKILSPGIAGAEPRASEQPGRRVPPLPVSIRIGPEGRAQGVYDERRLLHPLVKDGRPVRWYLSRAPHVERAARAREPPSVTYPFRPIRKRWHLEVKNWKMSDWYRWGLFDGRYWVRVRHRLPCRISIAPFQAGALQGV